MRTKSCRRDLTGPLWTGQQRSSGWWAGGLSLAVRPGFAAPGGWGQRLSSVLHAARWEQVLFRHPALCSRSLSTPASSIALV